MQPLCLLTTSNSLIEEVGITDEGFAVIGGVSESSTGYLAVVSPSGIATSAFGSNTPQGTGHVYAVSSPLDITVAPPSPAPVSSTVSAINTGSKVLMGAVLASSTTVDNHLLSVQNQWHKSLLEKCALEEKESPKTERKYWFKKFSTHPSRKKQSEANAAPSPSSFTCTTPTFSTWLYPFYENSFQSSISYEPSSRTHITGAVAGLDYRINSQIVVGGNGSYSYNRAKFSGRGGVAKVNQETVGFHTSYQFGLEIGKNF